MAIICAIVSIVWPNKSILSYVSTRLQITREHDMWEGDTMLYTFFRHVKIEN